jgi:hypothetical protein
MKKILMLSAACIFLQQQMDAQAPGSGMQESSTAPNRFSHLNRPAGILGPLLSEKAIGVYHANTLPLSFVEINTLPGMFTTPPLSSITSMGEMFRTNSPVDGYWRLFVNNGQVGSVSSQGADFNLEATSANMRFNTTPAGLERMRIRGADGYVGVNNVNPLFHMDMITPAFLGGELFHTCKPSDVPKSDLGFCNGAFNNNVFLPIVFGKVDASQTGPGLQTVGNIDILQDIPANNANWGVTRFVSSQGWVFNSVGLQPLRQRHLFSWSNASIVGMLMDVNGRLGIRDNMNTVTQAPRNRLEITASVSAITGQPDPYMPLTANGASGLRLTLMTATCTPVSNPGQGVLAVDNNGDVIYVKASSSSAGCCIGNPCTTPGANPLTQTWEVPMTGGGGNWNYMFNEAVSGGPCQVGIGHPTGTCNNTFGKFEVVNNTIVGPFYRFAGAFTNNGSQTGVNTVGVGGQANSTLDDGIGVRGQSTGAALGFTASGVVGSAVTLSAADINRGVAGLAAHGNKLTIGGDFLINGSSSGANYGVQTQVMGGTNTAAVNFGVYGIVSSPAVVNMGTQMRVFNATGNNTGSDISVFGTPTSQNLGIHLNVFGSGSSVNYGVLCNVNDNTTGMNFGGYFATAGSTTANYAVYGQSLPVTNNTSFPLGNYAGFFDGDVVTTSSTYYTSDRNLKKDIKAIESSMDIIKKLNPVTYNYDTEKHLDMGLAKSKQWGFISQEVKTVLPELTATVILPELKDKEGKTTRARQEYLGLNYNGFIAILAKGMQEQQDVIEKQGEAIKKQQEQIDELKALVMAQSGASADKQAVELSDKNVVVLNQNVPNPFAETTVITYNIPENFSNAQMLFYDSSGKLIKTVDIAKKGKGVLNVFANDLSSGVYSYSLVVDGKVTDTKKMMKQ